MPAKSNPKKLQPKNDRLRERLKVLHAQPCTHENMLAIARAYLEEAGDVPRRVAYGFGMECGTPEEARAIDAAVERLRAEHFKRLGKPVPKYTGPPLR